MNERDIVYGSIGDWRRREDANELTEREREYSRGEPDDFGDCDELRRTETDEYA